MKKIKEDKNRVLNVIKEMNERGNASYLRSVRTILRGSDGPVSSTYTDKVEFGSIIGLKTPYLKKLIEELIEESKLARFTKENRRDEFYYLNNLVNDRKILMGLLVHPTDISYLNYKNESPQKDSFEDETTSEKSIETYEFVTGEKKEVTTASSYERRFLEYCVNSDFILDVVEQPKTIDFKVSNVYTPDFLMQSYEGKHYIIEIKSEVAITHQLTLNKYSHLINYCNENNYGHALITMDNKTNTFYSLFDIANMPLDKKLEQHIFEILDIKETFDKDDLREYKKKYEVDTFALQTIIINNIDKIRQDDIAFTITKRK